MFNNKITVDLTKMILCLCLVVALFCGAYYNLLLLQKHTPNTIAIYDNSTKVKTSDFDQQQFGDKLNIAAAHEHLLKINPLTFGEYSTLYGNMIITTSNYGNLSKLKIVTGAYFNSTSIASAVVSDDYALTHFLSIDVIGKTVKINDNLYTICGVYQTDHNFLKEISSSKYDNIYISQCPLKNETICEPSYILASRDLYSENQIIDTINHEIDVPINGKIIDYRLIFDLMQSLFLVSIIICSMLFVWLLFKISFNMLYSTVVASNGNRLVFKAFLFAVFYNVLSIILLLHLCSHIKFPATYLPPDNIFDIAFYRQAIVGFYQYVNSQTLINNFATFYLTIIPVYISLLIGGIIFFYCFAFKLIKFLRYIRHN